MGIWENTPHNSELRPNFKVQDYHTLCDGLLVRLTRLALLCFQKNIPTLKNPSEITGHFKMPASGQRGGQKCISKWVLLSNISMPRTLWNQKPIKGRINCFKQNYWNDHARKKKHETLFKSAKGSLCWYGTTIHDTYELATTPILTCKKVHIQKFALSQYDIHAFKNFTFA